MLSISWGFISTILFSGTFCAHFAVTMVEASTVDLAAAVLCEHGLICLLYHIVAPQETVFCRLRWSHSDDVQLPYEPGRLPILKRHNSQDAALRPSAKVHGNIFCHLFPAGHFYRSTTHKALDDKNSGSRRVVIKRLS